MAEKEPWYIGQIFVGTYSPEAAVWCNSFGDRYIKEIDKDVNGTRRFQIVTAPVPTPEEQATAELAKAKEVRADAVSKIVVEVDGMLFNGDEVAQNRMGRTVSAATALGVDLDTTTQIWVLADDTVAQPTIKQLARALQLAGAGQTKLWTKPYESSAS